MATGWTWEYIGSEMTLPRLFAFAEYWKDWPPLNESVAAIAFGIGALVKRDPKKEQAELAEFAANAVPLSATRIRKPA
jgi:hypothetical protein